MCGIVGFLDKRRQQKRSLGATLLAMLDALSCRGPDSAGVALFGPHQNGLVLLVKLPEDADANAAVRSVLAAVKDIGAVTRHEVLGAYLRLEVTSGTEAAALENHLLAHVPGAEIVSLGHQLEIVKQVGSPAQLEPDRSISSPPPLLMSSRSQLPRPGTRGSSVPRTCCTAAG